MNDLLQPLVDLLHPAQQPGDDLHNEPHSDEADQQRHQSREDLAEAVAPTAVFRICLIFMQSYLRYRPAFRSASMSRFSPSTATFTEVEVSSLIF